MSKGSSADLTKKKKKSNNLPFLVLWCPWNPRSNKIEDFIQDIIRWRIFLEENSSIPFPPYRRNKCWYSRISSIIVLHLHIFLSSNGLHISYSTWHPKTKSFLQPHPNFLHKPACQKRWTTFIWHLTFKAHLSSHAHLLLIRFSFCWNLIFEHQCTKCPGFDFQIWST